MEERKGKGKIAVPNQWMEIILACLETNKGFVSEVREMRCAQHGDAPNFKMEGRISETGKQEHELYFINCCPEFVEQVLKKCEQVYTEQQSISIDREQ